MAPFRRSRIDRGNDRIAFVHQRNEEGILDPDTTIERVSFFERGNDSTITDDENSCARVNHVSADIFIQRDRTVGRNETEEEMQAELHNATRETQEWKKPLVRWQMAMGSISVSIWPWWIYRRNLYTLHTLEDRYFESGTYFERCSHISYIVRFDNGWIFPEKNGKSPLIGSWKDASNWKGLESRVRERS